MLLASAQPQRGWNLRGSRSVLLQVLEILELVVE